MKRHEKVIIIAEILGIKFKEMTIYRAELIHLKNDNIKAEEIAKILNTNREAVYKWYNKQTQPKASVIEKLENMYFEREKRKINELRNPKY